MIKARYRAYILKKKLKPIFELVGINGDITIKTRMDEQGYFYTINVGNEHEFIAFYPDEIKEDLLTITLVDRPKELESGFKVQYTEALILKAKGYVPYKFVIYKEPQTQTIYLHADKDYKKGDITYRNSCGYGGCFGFLDEPTFTSDLVDLSKLLDT